MGDDGSATTRAEAGGPARVKDQSSGRHISHRFSSPVLLIIIVIGNHRSSSSVALSYQPHRLSPSSGEMTILLASIGSRTSLNDTFFIFCDEAAPFLLAHADSLQNNAPQHAAVLFPSQLRRILN
jgi:hypothetical protein